MLQQKYVQATSIEKSETKTRTTQYRKRQAEVHCAFALIVIRTLWRVVFVSSTSWSQDSTYNDTTSCPQTRCLPPLSNWLGCCREQALTGTPLPPGVCLPKSAKAGVKSGPQGNMRGSRVRIGNLGWLICTHEEAQKSLKHTSSDSFRARKLPQTSVMLWADEVSPGLSTKGISSWATRMSVAVSRDDWR